jgi:hypothetical protein
MQDNSSVNRIYENRKYTWQYYKTGEDILSELKFNPVVKKMQNYRNKWTETDCHT